MADSYCRVIVKGEVVRRFGGCRTDVIAFMASTSRLSASERKRRYGSAKLTLERVKTRSGRLQETVVVKGR